MTYPSPFATLAAMNARTIVYLVLMAALFLGMNFFFSYQNDKKNRVIREEMEAKKRSEMLAHREEYKERTAELSSLPLVSFEGQSGLLDGQNLLTIAWTSSLPTSIEISGQTLYLKSTQSVDQGPVLYGPEKFEELELASIPSQGRFDVQLVTLGSNPKVYLGELNDGQFDLLSGFPQSNAIALIKSKGRYLPAGFYEARGKSYISLQKIPVLSGLFKKEGAENTPKRQSDEQTFVLENSYQQLVFTNVGGALREINLPLRSDKNTQSVVNPIDADREIAEDSPANDHFPASSYTLPGGKTVKEGKVGGYYPLLRRSISGGTTVEPRFYGMNLVSDYPEMAELVYSVKEFTEDKIVFEATQPNRRITKSYSLSKSAPYLFDLEVSVEGDARGLWLTSGVPDVEIISKASSPKVQYRLTRKGKGEMEKVSLPKAKESVSVASVHPQWMVTSNGYLGVIMDPISEIGPGFKVRSVSGSEAPTRLSLINPRHAPYPAAKYPGYELLLPIPSKGGSFSFRVYAGPFEEATLKNADAFVKEQDGENPKYIDSRSFHGWFSFISRPFAKLLFVVMEFFHALTHSWGIAIILLTVFLRILLYPLNTWSFKSMRRMQQLSPMVKAIQERHKKDPKRAQIEIMTLYREKKVNPFMGCFPILIQLPFLFAMLDLLRSSFQLRGASFIPGWINNLTAPDVLFSWQSPIFFIGNQFHLLPILLGVVMFFQQRIALSMRKKKDEELTDQERQQKSMGTVMAVIFTVMFYNFPSGLNIYWLSSMLLGILQQWITNKRLDKQGPEVEVLPARKKGRK